MGGISLPSASMTCASSASSAAPASMASTPTASSLARKAAMEATVAFQSPRPIGAKIQEILLPNTPSMDSSTSSTISKLKL